MCTVYPLDFFFNIITDFMKNSAFSFCGSYYFMAALA